MRLSESLQRNIMKVNVGILLNMFLGRTRRDILIFEDLLASYIKECEKSGYAERLKNIHKVCSAMTVQSLLTKNLKTLPFAFLTKIVGRVWKNLGLVDHLHVTKKGNFIEIETKNEFLTRIIGKNISMVGFYEGILNGFFKSEIECSEILQTKNNSKYIFKIKTTPFVINKKDMKIYGKLNYSHSIKGFTFKDAIKRDIFQLKQNKIYFRGKSMIPLENTIFHLLSNEGLLLEKLSQISYNFFKDIVEKQSTKEKKLILLKNFLQLIGWGSANISIIKNDKILLEIRNPPYGLQNEKDNWQIFYRIILGYLWLLDKKYKIKSIKESHKVLEVLFVKHYDKKIRCN
jgi:hypothetical protein